MKRMIVALLVGICAVAQAQDLPEQIKDLAPVLESQKEFADGMRAWGKTEIATATGDLDEAKTLLRKRMPDEAKAKKQSAVDRVKKVREAYEFALAKYANDATLHNAYGELLYDQFGDNAGALREWNLATSLDNKYAPPYNNLGLDQCHTGDYAIGVKNLERALELDPKNPDFMFNLAQIYIVNAPQVAEIKKWKPKKVYDHAMKLSKEATELDASDYQLAEDYAMNFFAAERFDVEADWAKAAEAWQRARPLAGRADRTALTWMNEARCWIRAEKPQQARPCLEEVLKIVPESAVAKQLIDSIDHPQPGDNAKKPKKHKK